MKRLAHGLVVAVVFLSVGCNNAAVSKPPDLSGTPVQSDPLSSLTEYSNTYNDENHKQLQYGKLSINFSDYHIVSDALHNGVQTFKSEIDKGKTRPVTRMTIAVREIKQQEFPDKASIISYLKAMSPNYEQISIYNNVSDESGIISLYSVTGDRQTSYVVSYKDASYLIESDYRMLDLYLFKKHREANYEVNHQTIECANSFTADVNKTTLLDDNKVEYRITQGRDGTTYSAELSRGKDQKYTFTLKSEKGESLIALSTYASDFNDVIIILDVNLDGYADIQFLEQAGAMNNSYSLYIWDGSAKIFTKVKSDEMLSEFEVHEGYLKNWAKDGPNSGVIQKLYWDKNTLIKRSEEPYKAE